MNYNKSYIFLSWNVMAKDRKQIAKRDSFSITANLGMYLEIPILHKRVTKDTFQHVIKKVQDKLAGCKRNYLSMAGRTILANLVIGAFLVYTIQVASIPKNTPLDIERYQQNFIWVHEFSE